MEAHSKEAVRNIYKRACTIHLTHKPSVYMAWAMFEEREGVYFIQFTLIMYVCVCVCKYMCVYMYVCMYYICMCFMLLVFIEHRTYFVYMSYILYARACTRTHMHLYTSLYKACNLYSQIIPKAMSMLNCIF